MMEMLEGGEASEGMDIDLPEGESSGESELVGDVDDEMKEDEEDETLPHDQPENMITTNDEEQEALLKKMCRMCVNEELVKES